MERKVSGYENIESFLGYCNIHSQTKGGLFNIGHVHALYNLAELSLDNLPVYDPNGSFSPKFYFIHYEEMKKIIKVIRTKMGPIERKVKVVRSSDNEERRITGNVVNLDDYR